MADIHDHSDDPKGELVQLPCLPDGEAMAHMVNTLFRYAMRGKIEIAWTDPHRDPKTKRHNLDRAALFELNETEDLVARAEAEARIQNQNLYLSAGLRRPDCASNRRAKASDVIAVAALKADCDAPGCLAHALQICDEKRIPPSLVVFTGREPHLRGSLWWVLEEPDGDLARVEALERAIARLLASDPSVVNPDRVMRFAGSVAWPLKAGRTLEMTGLHHAPTRAAPYTLDEIEHALGPVEAPAAPLLDFSAAKPTHELDALLRAAHEPSQWHKHALLATAHLIGRGAPPDVVVDLLTPQLTMPGYLPSQTRQELTVMVRGAMAKGWAPAQPEKAASQSAGNNALKIWSVDELESRDPPSWIIGSMIPENAFVCLYGESNTFKSFVALDMALCIAYGLPWHGRQVKQGAVLYVIGEGQTAFANRVRVWREAHGFAATTAPFYSILEPIQFGVPADIARLTEAVRAHEISPDWTWVDTLARNFGPGDPDKTQDMQAFVAGCGRYQSTIGGGLGVVHHAGKDPTKGARNSTVLKAAVDVEMRSDREPQDPFLTLHTTKQKDAEQAKPIMLEARSMAAMDTRTGEEITSLILVAAEEKSPPEPPSTPPRLGRNERAVMALLTNVHPLRYGQIKTQTGIESGTLNRTLTSLINKKMVAKHAESYTPVTGVTGVSESDEETAC